jgi:hypothetical protein
MGVVLFFGTVVEVEVVVVVRPKNVRWFESFCRQLCRTADERYEGYKNVFGRFWLLWMHTHFPMPDTYSYRYDINMSHRYDRLFCVYYSGITSTTLHFFGHQLVCTRVQRSPF